MNAQEPVQILIVDDHRDNLLALEAVLSPLGYRILQAESGCAALKVLLQEEVALMLLDVTMPDVNGHEVAELIRGRPANRDMPIIFITANPKSASAAFKGYSVGAVDYIFKPVSADVLISKVNVFVDLYRRSCALKRQAEDLRRAHDALDLRVHERTEQLARANQRLKAVIAQRRRAEAERADLLLREQSARREAERVNRLKDEFLATLSHELRTPLNAMLGWAQLLETGQLDPDRLQRAVNVIKHNAFAQKQLIEDILDVSRIVNGKGGADCRGRQGLRAGPARGGAAEGIPRDCHLPRRCRAGARASPSAGRDHARHPVGRDRRVARARSPQARSRHAPHPGTHHLGRRRAAARSSRARSRT